MSEPQPHEIHEKFQQRITKVKAEERRGWILLFTVVLPVLVTGIILAGIMAIIAIQKIGTTINQFSDKLHSHIRIEIIRNPDR